MQSLKLLHVSDLHVSIKDFADQSIIFKALFADLTQSHHGQKPFDLIFLTGDLISKGAYTTENVTLLQQGFIEPLLAATKVTNGNLFICPGNHDLQLKNVSPLVRPALDSVTNTTDLKSFIDNLSAAPAFFGGFEGFNSLLKTICTTVPVFENGLFRAYTISIAGLSIGICALNSAWRSTGAANNEDYGKLLVGQRQVDLLAAAVAHCDVKLALLHHPLAWLAPFDQSDIHHQLYRIFDGVFFGHNHEADSARTTAPGGTIFASNAGCLYQSRKYFNGYSIIEFNRTIGTWRVCVREYLDQRQVFDSSTRFAAGGEITFTVTDDPAARAIAAIPSGDYLSAIQETIDSQLLPSAISEVAPRHLKSLYVEPPLSKMSQRQLPSDTSESASVSYIPLEAITSSHNHVFFIGPKESGKTTLLHYICGECVALGFQDIPRFGCYVNLQTVKTSRAGILEAIVAFSRGAYRRAEFIDLLNSGRMTLCFDNLSPEDDDLLAVVAAFAREFPQNRYFFTVHENFRMSLTQRAIPRLGLSSDVVYIHSFGRRHTRSLVSKWFGDSSAAMRQRVDALLSSFKRLNIPRTPFLISAFLWVQERNISFSPVNHSELLETFVDGMLDKFSESKDRSHLDSNVKRHFLMELSFAMHESGKRHCSQNELEKFAVDYFSRKVLPSASGPFLEELKTKGILVELNDEVSFKFDCLRAFFLSIKLKESPALLDKALTEIGFIQLGEELDYFTGRNRDRSDVLAKSVEIVDRAFKAAHFELQLSIFDELSSEGMLITPERRDVIELGVLGERPTEERQEEMLDEMDHPSLSPRQNAAKPIGTGSVNTFALFAEALQTASAVLRNSELVDDAILKHESYAKLNYYWCQLALAVMATIELVTDAPPEHLLKAALPVGNRDTTIHALKLIAPNVVLQMALQSLGTEKLQLVISNHIDESEESIKKLVSVMLYADLRLPDWISKIRTLSEQSTSSKFLLELLFFKMVQIYLFKQLTPGEEKVIKALAADLFTKANKTSDKRERASMRSRIMQGLDKSKMMKALVNSLAEKDS